MKEEMLPCSFKKHHNLNSRIAKKILNDNLACNKFTHQKDYLQQASDELDRIDTIKSNKKTKVKTVSINENVNETNEKTETSTTKKKKTKTENDDGDDDPELSFTREDALPNKDWRTLSRACKSKALENNAHIIKSDITSFFSKGRLKDAFSNNDKAYAYIYYKVDNDDFHTLDINYINNKLEEIEDRLFISKVYSALYSLKNEYTIEEYESKKIILYAPSLEKFLKIYTYGNESKKGTSLCERISKLSNYYAKIDGVEKTVIHISEYDTENRIIILDVPYFFAILDSIEKEKDDYIVNLKKNKTRTCDLIKTEVFTKKYNNINGYEIAKRIFILLLSGTQTRNIKKEKIMEYITEDIIKMNDRVDDLYNSYNDTNTMHKTKSSNVKSRAFTSLDIKVLNVINDCEHLKYQIQNASSKNKIAITNRALQSAFKIINECSNVKIYNNFEIMYQQDVEHGGNVFSIKTSLSMKDIENGVKIKIQHEGINNGEAN